MEKIKILIVEDEVLIALDLKLKLTNADYEVTDVADTAEKALASFKKSPSDLVLMDINLKGSMDGIQTAKRIKEMEDVPVIFITDFKDDFTFKNAKESRPFDYIIKPYLIEDVLRTIELALVDIPATNRSNNIDHETPEYIYIPEKPGIYKRLKVSEILWLEANRSYCKIVTTDNTFTFSFPMNKALEQIKNPRFVRVHRSFAVNLDKLEGINGNMLDLGKDKVQMSSDYREEVMKKIHFMKG